MSFKYTTAYQTDDEFLASTKSLNDVTFKSNLKVFMDHDGFRGGEIHTFVGAKGSGKSTWCKTILTELINQDKNVFLYVSEEEISKYTNPINRYFRLKTKTAGEVEMYLNRIFNVSEMDDFDMCNEETFFKNLEEMIVECQIDILIFDNFTTSFLSELFISNQSNALRRFKQVAIRYNIPIVMFFHTSKNYNQKTLNGDNVRGSGTAINIGSYNYVMHQNVINNKIKNFIYTEKARYHNKANKSVYEIVYDSDSGLFSRCFDFDMASLKEIMKNE